MQASSANAVLYVDGEYRAYFLGTASNEVATFTEIVPHNSTYMLSVAGSLTFLGWHELR
jgi:hypothetical protein